MAKHPAYSNAIRRLFNIPVIHTNLNGYAEFPPPPLRALPCRGGGNSLLPADAKQVPSPFPPAADHNRKHPHDSLHQPTIPHRRAICRCTEPLRHSPPHRRPAAPADDEADILWTAWDGERLVGVARALTDYAYACYLSDLAVDAACQRQGIGKTLVAHLQAQIGADVALILLAAANAMDYYPKIGFEALDNGFIIRRRPF